MNYGDKRSVFWEEFLDSLTAYPVQEFFTIRYYKVRKIPSPKFLFRFTAQKLRMMPIRCTKL